MRRLRYRYLPTQYVDAQNQPFRVVDQVATGGQGVVYLIEYEGHDPHGVVTKDTRPATPRHYIYKTAHDTHGADLLRAECEAMDALKHVPGIVHYLTTTNDSTGATNGYIRRYYELMTRQTIVAHATKIIATLQRLHAAGWVHGDIKLNNFCFDREQNTCLLMDFGSAQRIQSFQISTYETALFRPTERGYLSQQYRDTALPPEIFDLYGYAVMLYRAVGGTENALRWRQPVPTAEEVRRWQPRGVHPNLHDTVRDIFFYACFS
jgi:serine/threonine protein kinase